MSMGKHWRLPAAVLAAVTAVSGLSATAAGAATSATSATPAGAPAVHRPEVKLIAAQRNITLYRYGQHVYIDPGIWVASLGEALQFNVQRASYTKPITLTQVMKQPDGKFVRRHLPGWMLGKPVPEGLKHFLTLKVKNSAGKVVYSRQLLFCPDSYDAERAVPNSPANSLYPQSCATDPFPVGMVWGIQKGWAADPVEGDYFSSLNPKLPDGKYHVSESVNRGYRRLLHISAKDARAVVRAEVVKADGNEGRKVIRLPADQGLSHAKPPAAPVNPASVPELKNPPRASLPDLVPLPSWGIRTSHHGQKDLLNFGATVWVGHAPLDVEGFRSHGSPIMKAYQYFSNNGHIIGRTRAGTMGFDNQKGHHHWHFEQFARYRLLSTSKSVVVRSHKQGFCIAPTDPVDLIHNHALWQLNDIGFGGQCGSPTALWVTEYMPTGWGDTYVQAVAGQAFNITNLKNGVYYLAIIANPERVLHESSTKNDTSLRKVILGGTPGHRTVRVPAWHGLDPE
jgi:hypothetical protein